MPDTHATRVTDTATMIPEKIPIPMATIDDHLRATTEHLITLILNKRNPHGGPKTFIHFLYRKFDGIQLPYRQSHNFHEKTLQNSAKKTSNS